MSRLPDWLSDSGGALAHRTAYAASLAALLTLGANSNQKSGIDNDQTRAAMDVDPVQDFSIASGDPAGLGGKGVQIGVFDLGIDEDHDDFKTFAADAFVASRVLVTDPTKSYHGTLVAGVIAGSGRRSDGTDGWGVANGGTPYQWRGMAPQAELLEVLYPPIVADQVAMAKAVHDMIVDHGMDLSNHSYQLTSLGSYNGLTAQRDAMIRGDATSAGAPIPPRLQIFPAGNQGGYPDDVVHSASLGYFALDNAVKNGLVVGSWRASESRVVGSSSLGPAYDGRIKPDVVAPGSHVTSTAYWEPGYSSLLCTTLPSGTETGTSPRAQFYANDCGSSLAAAAVSGVVALVLQQYSTTYGVDLDVAPPLPSTLRGIIIHTAHDVSVATPWFTNADGPVQAFPGPDFVTGFGLVNAADAVALTAAKQLREDVLNATCDAKTFQIPVYGFLSSLTTAVRVTLTWDDPAGDGSLPATTPQLTNDLDLVLVDPAGGRHYPWQRNQRIRSSAGTLLTPEQQSCGTAITVDRILNPPGPLAAADLAAASAGTGPDHLNNVEQVVAPAMTGTWKAIVTGFKLGSPQTFSLIGVPTQPMLFFRPQWICKVMVALCQAYLFDLCKRYPPLCAHEQIIPLFPPGPRITFHDPDDRVIIPLAQLCAERRVRGACTADSVGAAYRIEVGATVAPLGIEIYSSRGRRVAGDSVSRQGTVLSLRAVPHEEYFLVFTPSRLTAMRTPYSVPLTVRRTVP